LLQAIDQKAAPFGAAFDLQTRGVTINARR